MNWASKVAGVVVLNEVARLDPKDEDAARLEYVSMSVTSATGRVGHGHGHPSASAESGITNPDSRAIDGEMSFRANLGGRCGDVTEKRRPRASSVGFRVPQLSRGTHTDPQSRAPEGLPLWRRRPDHPQRVALPVLSIS